MTDETDKKSAGRPTRNFDQKIFEGLCSVCCTVDEIEHIFQSDIRTLNKWCVRTYGQDYSTVYKKYSDGAKASLRRYQFQLAKTNAAMCIWLGKQWLGQREKQPDEATQIHYNVFCNDVPQQQAQQQFAKATS